MTCLRACWAAEVLGRGQEEAGLQERPDLVGDVGGAGADQLLVGRRGLAEDDRPMGADDRLERREADVDQRRARLFRTPSASCIAAPTSGSIIAMKWSCGTPIRSPLRPPASAAR